jgi:hypothetical protein
VWSNKRITNAGFLHRFDRIEKPMTTNTKPKQQRDWGAIAQNYATGNRDYINGLDKELGFPTGSCGNALGTIGYSFDDANGECWTIPMRDGFHNIIGISRRYLNGDKKSLGNNGLFIPHNWDGTGEGPIFIVEGASDTIAMTTAGLTAFGRPSSLCGAGASCDLLESADESRPIIVVGENDEKASCLWPGLSGALDMRHRFGRGLVIAAM